MPSDRRRRGWGFLAAVAVLTLAAGCGDGDTSDDGADSGARASAPTAGSEDARYSVDMDEIFPRGPGRDLVLNNCQNCHTWVPIVVLQMNEQEWNRWAREHRGRVEALTDEEFDTLRQYLIDNFNPETPVPDLPPALLETWTSY